STSLLRRGVLVLLGEVVGRGRAQKPAQPSNTRRKPLDDVALQEREQEALHRVLRRLRGRPLLPKEHVERAPVDARQLTERSGAQLRTFAGLEDEGPARGREEALSLLGGCHGAAL